MSKSMLQLPRRLHIQVDIGHPRRQAVRAAAVEVARALPPMPEVLAEAVELLTKFSIPLYANDKYRRPVLFGPAFSCARRTIIFSYPQRTSSMSLAPRACSSTPFRTNFVHLREVCSRPVLTTGLPDKRDDDLLDIGVMKLSGEAALPYPEVET